MEERERSKEFAYNLSQGHLETAFQSYICIFVNLFHAVEELVNFSVLLHRSCTFFILPFYVLLLYFVSIRFSMYLRAQMFLMIWTLQRLITSLLCKCSQLLPHHSNDDNMLWIYFQRQKDIDSPERHTRMALCRKEL